MQCPECGHIFFVASAWSGPEPECEHGVICPHCNTFIADDDLLFECDDDDFECNYDE